MLRLSRCHGESSDPRSLSLASKHHIVTVSQGHCRTICVSPEVPIAARGATNGKRRYSNPEPPAPSPQLPWSLTVGCRDLQPTRPEPSERSFPPADEAPR
eukprot:s1358_g8.t1